MKQPEIYKALSFFDLEILPIEIMFSYRYKRDRLLAALNRKGHQYYHKALSQNTGLMEVFDSEDYIAFKCQTIHDTSGKPKTVIGIAINSEFDFSDESFCILGHEITHICQFLGEVFFDRGTEYEFDAYLHSYIQRYILKVLRMAQKAQEQENKRWMAAKKKPAQRRGK